MYKFQSNLTDLETLVNGYENEIVQEKKLEKKLYGPFLWMGSNCLKATATSGWQFTFYHWVPRNSWHSFYRPRKDERLSRSWSHPVVFNTGLLDWESSALTTRPLLHKVLNIKVLRILWNKQSDEIIFKKHLKLIKDIPTKRDLLRTAEFICVSIKGIISKSFCSKVIVRTEFVW